MPSSALGTMLRIRRNIPEMGNNILRADEGIGPYKGVFLYAKSQLVALFRSALLLSYHSLPSDVNRNSSASGLRRGSGSALPQRPY